MIYYYTAKTFKVGTIMAYIEGLDRNQTLLFPESLEEYIDEENPVRVFDAFINSLNMEACGISRDMPAEEGRPGYDPRCMLKLYIYGYFNRIRSSRLLHKETKRNVEVMWLINKLSPDFRTISDFRKNNHKGLKLVFKEFNKLCVHMELYSHECVSVDGSKFKAVNSRNNNFNLNKLDDRLTRLDSRIEEYMLLLEQADKSEPDERSFTKTEIEEKLKMFKKRKELYCGYRDKIERTGNSQISLTDPEAKLMKTHEGYKVAYNVQTAVDAKYHMIADYKVTNSPTDHGLLNEVAQAVKDDFGLEIIEAIADKGYRDGEDLANCLLNGTIPNVHPNKGVSSIDLETDYVETENAKALRKSKKADDIKRCLQAGLIPNIYKEIITKIDVVDKNCYIIPEETFEFAIDVNTEKEMIAKAKEGFFVRDIKRNRVYCPAGKILRQKSVKKNGYIRYTNKFACSTCHKKCTKTKGKEVDFSPEQTILLPFSNQPFDNGKMPKRTKKTKRVVKFKFLPNKKKLDMRQSLSEHPFGTIKKALDGYYFLLKGKEKTGGEMALLCMAYNLKRAINIHGTRKIIENLIEKAS